MVIHNLDLIRVAVAPDKAYAPLVVDPNTVLALTVARQLFESVSARNGQVSQFRGEMYLVQFSPCHALNGFKPPHRFPAKETLRAGATERADHTTHSITGDVKRKE